MSGSIKISPCIKPLHQFSRPLGFRKNPFFKVPVSFELNSEKLELIKRRAVASFSKEATFDSSLISIQLEPILSEDQFNLVIHEHAAVIVWVANWCRKCIYLKPKLEKLAAHYQPSIQFYSVDVNNVSHKLVARAEVTLWSNGKKQGEVIGGHNKAYLVVNEVRDMIENENSSL